MLNPSSGGTLSLVVSSLEAKVLPRAEWRRRKEVKAIFYGDQVRGHSHDVSAREQYLALRPLAQVQEIWVLKQDGWLRAMIQPYNARRYRMEIEKLGRFDWASSKCPVNARPCERDQ